MIAAPDVVRAAFALDQELIDIGGRSADMGIRRALVALLVAAHAGRSRRLAGRCFP